MKLLFDQNISRKLVQRLADTYPESTHVALIEMDRSTDKSIWEYAFKNEYLIVSKDTDFCEMAILRGFPPKVIWLRRGNCSTDIIESILRNGKSKLEKLERDIDSGILILD